MRRKGECKAKVQLSVSDDLIGETNEHTHSPSQTQCEVTKMKANIKRKAETTEETSQQILGAELQNVSEGAAVVLPPMSTLRRNIRYQRQERNLPPTPFHQQNIPALPHDYQITADGNQFLVHDSGFGDEERILIFASQQGLRFLVHSDHWYADGTFKVCPELSFQVYNVHGQRDGKIFPCVCALLPNKTEATYNRFFLQLFNVVNGDATNLNDILVDFENTAIKALRAQKRLFISLMFKYMETHTNFRSKHSLHGR